MDTNQEEISWTLHSPNVALARNRIKFEVNEHKYGFLDFEKLSKKGKFEERSTNPNKCVEPRKVVEKNRVFDFVPKLLSKESKTQKHACY